MKHKLHTKLLLLLIIVSTIPLAVINIVWFNSARDQILNTTSETLRVATEDKSHQIENFIALKKIGLTIHSQTESFLSLDVNNIKNELNSLFLQDQDITDAVIIDKEGQEIIRMTRDSVSSDDELIDQSSSPAFKITTFVGGQEYISPVYIDTNGEPGMYIAIPIVTPDEAQELQNLSTSSTGEFRKPGEILGVFKVNFRLTNLWREITEEKIGQNGYAFIIDDKGNVITHKDAELFKSQANLKGQKEIDAALTALNEGQDQTIRIRQSVNEYEQPVLITHASIRPLHWSLVTQIPLSDTFSAINRVALLAMALFIISINFIILAGLWISKQIVNPIKQLQKGAQLMGKGYLDHKLTISTGDEIEDLTEEFNTMATSLRESIDQISAEKNKLRVLLYGITDAVIAVDSSRNILTFNKAAEELTGYSESQVMGQPIKDVIKIYDNVEEVPADRYAPLQSSNISGVVFNRKELILVGVNNKKSYVNLITGQIKEGRDVNLSSILTFHDITQEKQLEEMKLDFVSIAAHELRTPLTSLRGYTYILMRDYRNAFDSKVTNIVDRINISTQRLIGLVENLLNVTRIEKGALTVHSAEMDWVKNIKEVIAEVITIAKDKHIEITFIEQNTKVSPVRADKLRINEVITNLLANAINYTQPGGKIWVWVVERENEIVTCIKDTGEGIPASALPRLFTKFFRVSGRLEQGSKGTGLGLYISKSIVEMHNGKIWAASEGLGKGTTFCFTLPKVVHSTQAQETPVQLTTHT